MATRLAIALVTVVVNQLAQVLLRHAALEGIVEHISWRHTRVRAFNRNPIYVPNALFSSIVVENPSRMSHRRIRETIGVRYDDFHKVDAITADIRRMLREHPDIDQEDGMVVDFDQFGASSLDMRVDPTTIAVR